jgi:hypothetical protein
MIMNNPVSSFFHPSSFEVWMEFWIKVLTFLFVDVFFCHPWASVTWWRNVRLMPLKLVNLMNETIFIWIESFWSMVASSPCTFISRTLAVETKWKIDWFLIGVWIQNSRSRHVLRGRDGPRLGTNSPFLSSNVHFEAWGILGNEKRNWEKPAPLRSQKSNMRAICGQKIIT